MSDLATDIGMDEARRRFHVLHEIVSAARANLDQNIWDYMRGATETETTAKRNRQALDRVALRPRVLRDVRNIDCSGSFLGTKLRIPVLLAPIGSLESFDPHGGTAAMQAAARHDVALMLSSVGTVSLEEVAKVEGGYKIAMLYKRGDRQSMDDYVKRAIDAGYASFCLTVDSAVYSRRERDIANRFVKPWRSGDGADWQAALNWDDIKHYKDTFEMPLILKGIATAEDAAIAVDHGVDCVYVSNHGGRQLDHGRGSLDVLPEVVEAVGGKAEIAVDGAFNRGTDVIKAIAMGADIVGLGRMLCCGLAAGGADGCARMLELLEEEIYTSLGLLGVTSLDQLDQSYLHPAEPVDAAHVHSAFPLLGPRAWPY